MRWLQACRFLQGLENLEISLRWCNILENVMLNGEVIPIDGAIRVGPS
jgi:hypothetical protein